MYDFSNNPIESLEDGTYCVWATYSPAITGEHFTSRNFFNTLEEAEQFVKENS